VVPVDEVHILVEVILELGERVAVSAIGLGLVAGTISSENDEEQSCGYDLTNSTVHPLTVSLPRTPSAFQVGPNRVSAQPKHSVQEIAHNSQSTSLLLPT
jgi:hypothetical protein